MKKTPFASFCETYNQPYIVLRDKRGLSPRKDSDRRVYDCTRHLRICTQCNTVYEFRYPVGSNGSMRVFKYSELPKIGFPKEVCQHCLDGTVKVEQY